MTGLVYITNSQWNQFFSTKEQHCLLCRSVYVWHITPELGISRKYILSIIPFIEGDVTKRGELDFQALERLADNT